MKKRYFIILILIFLILAIFSRFIFLNSRPLHLDEAVDWFFAKNIIDGNGYTYDPANYHGTIFYFLIAIDFLIFGISEYSLRMTSALAGIILIIIPLFIRFKEENFNKYGKYIASGLILISPSISYYSRDCRQEALLLLFSFLSVYFLTKIFETKDLKYLQYFSVFFALAFVTKETTIILAIALFVICIFNLKTLKSLNFKENKDLIIFSILIFIFIWVVFYSSFFTNIYGITDSFKSIIGWGGHGISQHNKPFQYYILLIIKYELPLLILGLIGIFYSFKTGDIFSKNVSIWFIIAFIIYSLIPYKISWLVINITVPLCLLSAIAITNIYQKHKKIAIILLLASVIYLIYFSIILVYITPWQESNQYAYAHTDADILNMVKFIENSKGNKVLVMSEEYWPIPFYLTDKSLSYMYSDNLTLYYDYLNQNDFVIVDQELFNKLDLNEISYKKYTLRPRVNLYLTANRANELNL